MVRLALAALLILSVAIVATVYLFARPQALPKPASPASAAQNFASNISEEQRDPDSQRVMQECAKTLIGQRGKPGVRIEIMDSVSARIDRSGRLRTTIPYTSNGTPMQASCEWGKYKGRWEPPDWVERQHVRDHLEALQSRTPEIGMSADEVRMSKWGFPDSVNSTKTAYGTHEQWVYGGRRYLYFTNDRLTSIQDSR